MKTTICDEIRQNRGTIRATLTDDKERISVQIEVRSSLEMADRPGVWESGVVSCGLRDLMDLIEQLSIELTRMLSRDTDEGNLKAMEATTHELY